MLWFILAVASYAFFALSSIGDKYLLSGSLPHPVTYAFYVGLLGGLVLFLTPFLGFPVPAPGAAALALAAGAIFIGALIVYYRGVLRYEVSSIDTAIGGLLPFMTLAASVMIFPNVMPGVPQIVAFILFIGASIVATAESVRAIISRGLMNAFFAAVLFAAYFVLMKAAYLAQPFWSGFLWMRLGALATALVLFTASPRLRRDAREHAPSGVGGRGSFLATAAVLGNQGLGAAGAVLQNIAVAVVPPLALAFVNALQGVQYVFVIVFAALFSRFAPSIIHESHTRRVIIQRTLAALLILAGTVVLVAAQR